MLTIGLENYMHLHLFLTENPIIYVSFNNRGRITQRLPHSLLELKVVSSPKILHMLQMLWHSLILLRLGCFGDY